MLNRDILLSAYKKMFDNTPFEKYLHPKDTYYEYRIVGIDESVQRNTSSVACVFIKANPDKMIPNIKYEYICTMAFNYVTNAVIDEFFRSKNYDYELVNRALKEVTDLGIEYGFIKEFTIGDFSVEEQFKSTLINKTSSFRPAGVITFSNALVEFDNDFGKMIYKRTLNVEVVFIVKNNEIHPVLMIAFPFTAKKKYYMYLDIHKDHKHNHEYELLNIQQSCIKKMNEHVDILLMENFKMNNSDLNKMNLEAKLDYLKVLEMGMI